MRGGAKAEGRGGDARRGPAGGVQGEGREGVDGEDETIDDDGSGGGGQSLGRGGRRWKEAGWSCDWHSTAETRQTKIAQSRVLHRRGCCEGCR